jgi:cysteinyl-tRNA synthetase
LSKKSVVAAQKMFYQLVGDVLGLIPKKDKLGRDVEPFIELITEMRKKIREKKMWQESDRIRDLMKELGVMFEDGKENTHWRFIQ